MTLVFIRFRKETAKTTKFLRDTAIEKETITQLVKPDGAVREILHEEAGNVKDGNLRDLLPFGFAIHRAVGHGIIITNHSELKYYLSLLNQQLPLSPTVMKPYSTLDIHPSMSVCYVIPRFTTSTIRNGKRHLRLGDISSVPKAAEQFADRMYISEDRTDIVAYKRKHIVDANAVQIGWNFLVTSTPQHFLRDPFVSDRIGLDDPQDLLKNGIQCTPGQAIG
ncbi:hypothetical protein ONZ45_g15352 [Pleurotus djamor]|nr:hypothetical protein ONZ45_g15352 [Pleurotus djamor]